MIPRMLSLLAAAVVSGRRDDSASALFVSFVVPSSSSSSSHRPLLSPRRRLLFASNDDGSDWMTDGGGDRLSSTSSSAVVVDGAGSAKKKTTTTTTGRRPFLLAALSTTTTMTTVEARAASSTSSSSDLFRPNPLTNPVLERIRIWNQDEVDNVVYGGELAPAGSSSSSRPGGSGQEGGGLDQYYVGLLMPILAVERDLNEIDALVRKEEEKGGGGGVGKKKGGYASLLAKVDVVLSRSRFDKIEFKRAFNAFADNIYYSDPDRANLYLGGGAIPKNSQSIAYLLRNEILTNVEDMRAEVGYLMREVGKMMTDNNDGDAELDLDEMRRLSVSANDGMKKYLDLVPPRELGAARAEFYASLLPPPAS